MVFRIDWEAIPVGPLRLITSSKNYNSMIRRTASEAERSLRVPLQRGQTGLRYRHPMILRRWVIPYYNTTYGVAVLIREDEPYPFTTQTVEACQEAVSRANVRVMVVDASDIMRDAHAMADKIREFTLRVKAERETGKSPSI